MPIDDRSFAVRLLVPVARMAQQYAEHPGHSLRQGRARSSDRHSAVI